MLTYINNISVEWKKVWANSNFRAHFALTVVLFVLSSLHGFHFLRIWQMRQGLLINDRILDLLTPHDFSIPIFILEYSSMLLVIFCTLIYPEQFLKGMQMFIIITFARTLCIYYVPLEPPMGMVPLNDPMASLLLHTDDVFVTKDLFFSGHVSALTMLFLISKQKLLRQYVAFSCVMVSILILWQHVHYSLDVLAAPAIAYLSYALVNRLHTQTKFGLEVSEA